MRRVSTQHLYFNKQHACFRSGIYCFSDEQKRMAEATRDQYQKALSAKKHGKITTEIVEAPKFYYAEDYHQQYLHKNPGGYCGLGGCNVDMPKV